MSYLGRSAKLSRKTQEKVSFLATAGQTSKTGLSYVPTFVEVSVNGILLTDVTDYTATTGSSVSFGVALELNDEVTVVALKTFALADHYTKTQTDSAVSAAAAALVDSSPAALNTLNELAAALGDDANYATTTTNAIATKMPKSGGAFTGAVTTNSTIDGRDVAADGVLATNAMPKSGGAFTGAVTTNSTIDGRDVAADGVLATNAMSKSGGSFVGNVIYNDGVQAKFGTSGDLSIRHDGSNSYLQDAGSGDLIIKSNGTNVKIIGDNDEDIAKFTWNGSTELYHNGSKKIETTATGAYVTGDQLRLTGSGSQTYVAALNTGSGEATFFMDSSNGDLSGSDYSWIKQKNNLDVEIGSAASTNRHLLFSPDGSEKMRILGPSGEVLIGTTSQGRETDLAIVGSDQSPTGAWSQVGIYSNDSYAVNKGGSLMFGGQDGTNVRSWFAGIKGAKENSTSGNYAGYLAFYTRPSGATPVERMRIKSNGYIVTPAAFSGGWSVQDDGDAPYFTTFAGSASYRNHFFFKNPNGIVGKISTSGSATAYTTSSDYRLKENVTPMSGATAQTKLLKPCNFDWIAGGNVNGFIAHELADVVPEAVIGTKDAMMDEEYEVTPATETEAAVMGTRSVPDLQGIDQSKLIPLLTATIQELITRIEALENV